MSCLSLIELIINSGCFVCPGGQGGTIRLRLNGSIDIVLNGGQGQSTTCWVLSIARSAFQWVILMALVSEMNALVDRRHSVIAFIEEFTTSKDNDQQYYI